MSQNKKQPLPQNLQLSSKDAVNDPNSMVDVSNDGTTNIKDLEVDEEIFQTQENKAMKWRKCKDTIMLLSVIVVVALILIYMSVTIPCLLERQNQNLSSNPQNANLGVDDGKQYVGDTSQLQAQNKRLKAQLQERGIKMSVLQTQNTKLSIQINKLKNGNHQPNNSPNEKRQPQQEKQPNGEKQKIEQNETLKNKETYRVRQKPRQNVPPKSDKDHYQFTTSIDNIVDSSTLNYAYKSPDSEWSGIKKPEYERAIKLMEVVHNINFKGEFVFDHYNFYKSAEEKYKAFYKLVHDQKQYYNKKYQINKYINDQIGMCIFVPSYNNAKTKLYLRNLDSIFQQDYKNYHLVYVNDASTDGTGDYVKSYMEENEIPAEKYTIINNQKNKGHVHNVYNVAHNHCKQGQILILLDGDDSFIGTQVLSLLNAVYQKQKIALTYGQFLLVRDNRVSGGFSRTIPMKNLQDGSFRQLKSFFSSHLKTMYVDIMRAINEKDLQQANGTFYGYAADVVYMTPGIEMVGTRLKFLTELNYEYRFDTGANDPHAMQVVVEAQIYKKTPYKKLESMQFADNPKTIHYE